MQTPLLTETLVVDQDEIVSVASPVRNSIPPMTADEVVAGPFGNVNGGAMVQMMQDDSPQAAQELRDFRNALFKLPPDRIRDLLTEYIEKRGVLRDWLDEQMKEGIHYGYPQGTKPKMVQAPNGEMCWETTKKIKGKNGQNDRYETIWVPCSSWTPRRTLYKAGSLLVVDLMNLIMKTKADMDQWVQFGKPSNVVVRTCELFSRSSGLLICEGSGARKVMEYGTTDTHHFALTMANKSALSQAVLSGFGLADKFVQSTDAEEPGGGPDSAAGKSPAKPAGPQEVPRDLQVQKKHLDKLYLFWLEDRKKKGMPDLPTDELVGDFFAFCHTVTHIPYTDGNAEPDDPLPQYNVIANPRRWDRQQMDACVYAIRHGIPPASHAPGESPGESAPSDPGDDDIPF